jgi:hypothetical protein
MLLSHSTGTSNTQAYALFSAMNQLLLPCQQNDLFGLLRSCGLASNYNFRLANVLIKAFDLRKTIYSLFRRSGIGIKWTASQLHIQKAMGSDLSLETGYHDEGFS